MRLIISSVLSACAFAFSTFAVQKHGAIIPLTNDEAERLAKHWELNMKFK